MNPWEREWASDTEAVAPWDRDWAGGEPAPQSKPRNLFAVANDTVIEAANAAAGGVQAVGDFIAPGNRVSQGIKSFIEEGEASQSDAVKAGKAKFREEVEAADGFGGEAAAVARYVRDNPLQTAAQAAGSFAIPGFAVKGAQVTAGALGLGAKGASIAGRAGGVAAGAAMAGGDAAGNAYELVMQIPLDTLMQSEPAQALLAQGADSAQIRETLATQAGRDASIIPALIGGAGGAFGAERILAGGAKLSGAKGAAVMAASEGLQEGVEEGATNYEARRAAARLDPSIDPMKGTGAAATLGAVLGAGAGAGVNVLAKPTADDVLAAETVDDAIATAQQALNTAEPASTGPGAAATVVADDPFMRSLDALSGQDRTDALAAYNMIRRPDAPAGVRQYNSRLLDALLEKAEDAKKQEALARIEPIGQRWQEIAPTDPAADVESQRQAAMSLVESERSGAAASRATDQRISDVGRTWKDLGIADPADDLQRQRSGMAAGPGVEPVTIWTGRAGDGYAAQEDAARALETRRKLKPDLRWEIEPMPSGKFRLAGYAPQTAMSAALSEAPAAAPLAEVTPEAAPQTAELNPEIATLTQRIAQLEQAVSAPAAAAGSPTGLLDARPEVVAEPAADQIQPGDLTRPNGKAYETEKLAAVRARKLPGATVTRVQGGFIIRPAAAPAPQPKAADAQTPQSAATTAAPAPIPESSSEAPALSPAAVPTPGPVGASSNADAALSNVQDQSLPARAEAEPAAREATAPVGSNAAAAVAPVPGAGNPVALEAARVVPPADILGADGAPFRTRLAAKIALKRAGAGHEVAALAEGGFAVRKLPKAAAPPAAPKPLRVGVAPGSAEPVTVRDGVVYVGKYEALDFESGEPITVAADASESQIKEALRAAGAVNKRQKFFGGTDPEAHPQQEPEPDKDDAPVFRMGEADGGSLSVSQIERAVDKLTLNWLKKPEIIILESMADAPGPVRRVWEQQNSQGAVGAVEGFHWRGGVYIVADRMSSGRDIVRVLYHESLGHFGLRNVFGKDLDQVLRQVAVNKPKEMRAKAAQYGFDLSDEHQRMSAAEEILAEMAQDRPENTIVQRAVAVIRKFLRENVPGFVDLEMTDAEIVQQFLVPARNFVENGKRPGPNLRGTTEPMASRKDVVGNEDGGRSADDETTGSLTAAQKAQALDESRWLDRGLKLAATQKLYRGVSERTGKNTANLGKGLYVTTDRAEASQYGDVQEMSRDDLPQNPLRFPDELKYRAWESFVAREVLGYGRLSQFESKHGLPDQWVRQLLDPSIDGIQIGTGPGAWFVKFSNESTAPTSDGATTTGQGSDSAMEAMLKKRAEKPAFSRAVMPGQTSRAYSPEQKRAMRNVGFEVDEPSMKERAQALWQDAGKKMAQGIVDQFAPVKDLDKQAYGLLRLSKGSSGAFEAFLRGGKLKLTDGAYDFNDADRGGVVDKLLIPLQGEHHDFFRWIAANRAERLLGEGKEHLFTSADIAALKTLADGKTNFDYTVQTGPYAGTVTRDRTKIYADSQRVFNEFNKNVLDLAEQSGLIDGASRKLWEHEFYVPFYRVADDADGGVRGMNIKGSIVRQQAFKQLKGGKNALNADLLDNTLMNWAHLLDASAKNRAAKATLEAAERMGVAINAPQYTANQIGAATGNKSGVVWFMDGGQKRFFVVDDPYVLTALNSLEYAGMRNPVMNAMGMFKHALTIGVTASPFFKVRNLIRDSVQVIGTSSIGVNPLANVAEGWKLTNPKSDAYFRLLAGGGTIHFGTMLEGSEAKRVQALVESGVDDATILNNDNKVKAFYRQFIEPGITAYNELGNRGEAVNRATLYAQLRAQGMNHADASLQARDLMDFSMQGSFTTVRFLAQVVPFLNARLQGMYKLGRAAKEDPARFGAVLGATALFSLALLAAYSDDDDWKKREEWDRNNFWWFKFGGTAFRIPKPFEIGAIATLAERGFELAFDKEMTGKRFRQQVLQLLGDNLSMNPVPQLVKPIMDVYANKNSFSGRPIETMGMEKLKSEYRFSDRTSMTARAASTGLNAVTGLVGAEALSPVQIDHMLRGYFGWLGSFVVGAADVVARPAAGQPAQATPDYWKVASGGMIAKLDDAPSRYVSSMYEQAREIEQAYGTWRALLKQGKSEEAAEFFQDNRSEITKFKRIERIKRAEAKLNERVKVIERSNMSADEKRALIRTLRDQKDRVARIGS